MKTKVLSCLLSTSIKINLTIFEVRINFLPFSSSFAGIFPQLLFYKFLSIEINCKPSRKESHQGGLGDE